MRIFLFVFIVLWAFSLCHAGQVLYDGALITYDDTYSLKDFSGIDLRKAKLDGKTIYGSCFARELPDTKIFSDDMVGVRFIQNNLDNVFIPPGNLVMGGSQRKFKAQNDLRDWEIDGSGNPTKIVNEDFWRKEGYSVDKTQIPTQPIARWEDAPKP